MAKEEMLVTQALDERELLRKKIIDKISRVRYVATKSKGSSNISEEKQSVEDFEKDAKAGLQSIKDMIARYERLDSAILLSNATTEIKVGGRTMTVATAINLRKQITGYATSFNKVLLGQVEKCYEDAKTTIASTKKVADRQRETMFNNQSSKDGAGVINQESLNIINTACDNMIYDLVDPLDVHALIHQLEDEQDELEKSLETAIKVSNANTMISF